MAEEDDYRLMEDDETEVEGEGYTRAELRTVLVPSVALLVIVALALVGHHFLAEERVSFVPMGDVDATDDFRLYGSYQADAQPFGPHARAVNLSLDMGDHLVLDFTASGPPGGVQVRLQEPQAVDPGDAGPVSVLASANGSSGTIDLTAGEAGAFQLYFWHPAVAREPGTVDEVERTDAEVSYRLVIQRSRRPWT